MKNEEILKHLEQFKIVQSTDYYQEQIDRINLQRKGLSDANNRLILALTNLSKQLADITDYNKRTIKRWELLKKSALNQPNPWDTEARAILVAMFGVENVDYIVKGWDKITEGMYQSHSYRRSFRRPDKSLYFESQVTWLYNLWYSWEYNLSIEDYARYGNVIGDYQMPYLYAAAMDNGHPTLQKTLFDILQGNAEVGTVSRSIIKGLLLSENQENWEAVKNLLLAAQRQEGLRQTILECLDETSFGAMKYMLQVILDEDLLRFSSVVRALDVWTGMNWDAHKKSAIKSALSFGIQYLNTPETIPQGTQSKNNLEVYMALWAQGVTNVMACYPLLEKLIANGTQEKRNIALKFASQTDLYKENSKLVQPLYNSENLWDLYWVTQLSAITNFDEAHQLYLKLFNELPEKETVLPNKGFEWITAVVSKQLVTLKWIYSADKKEDYLRQILPYVKDFNIEGRETFARKVFTDFYTYRYQDVKKDIVPTVFQKEMALIFIEDRSGMIQDAASEVLKKAPLEAADIPVFEDILRKKSANLRKGVLGILVKQEDDKVFQSVESLSQSKLKNQRIAALDLLKQMHQSNRSLDKVSEYAQAYKENNTITADEEMVLSKLLQEKSNYTANNGWGLYNSKELLPVVLPPINASHSFHERIFDTKKGLFKTKKSNSGYSMPVEKIKEQLHILDKLIEQHKDVEFEAERYGGGTEMYLIGNAIFHPKRRNRKEESCTKEEWFNLFPLAQTWKEWFTASKLDTLDLQYMNFHVNTYDRIDTEVNPKWYFELSEKYFSPIVVDRYDRNSEYKYSSQMAEVLNQIESLYYQDFSSYWLEGAITICNEYPKEALRTGIKSQYNPNQYFTKTAFFYNYYRFINVRCLSDEDLMRYYQLELWINNSIYKTKGGTLLNLCQFKERLDLPEADYMYYIINKDILAEMTPDRTQRRHAFKWKEASPKLEQSGYLECVLNRVLEIEFARGESETGVTYLANAINDIEGVDVLVKCLKALGKESLTTGYSYYDYGTKSKKQIMSKLLQNCYPAEADTQEIFNEKIATAKFTEKRLIEVAMYAPQWQNLIQNYLNWKGLDSAIWWLHAHSSQYLSAKKETEIARYSAIPITEFNQGAVDVDWFNDVYDNLGKSRWKLVYDAAKYISYGNGHTLSKLYADVILKNVKITEVTKRVKDKRNQNYLRVYGLVPLSKTVPQKDVLKRYNYLQQFLKESKQFGSQRQESEKQAVKIAMDNLARNAGYPDPIRLTWSMESLQAQQLLSNAQELVFDETKIWLEVDDTGKASLQVTKKDKPLKNIPAKLRKDKKVMELKAYQKQLSEQYKRTRRSLEQAMVNQDEFTVEEIDDLSKHPVVKPMLEKLVLRTNTNHVGIWTNGELVNVDEKTYQPKEDEHLFIAHCTHLFDTKQWTLWQKHFFTNELKQPFKQVFRELYLPTPDEEKAATISKRYEGHQVQPKKTVALLKGRGWTVDYDNGLQKVLHKHNLIVELYAMADWFSPSDVENPTLETIRFYSKKDYKTVPFSEIPNYIFSEVMRDVDLVVSVAHAGGVDPEASLSTIELRKVIAEESAMLFKLNNVEFKERHAIITGHHANYSLHLGSGVVHVQPGGYVSIVPVHSQHRGRIFLPFVDEDPKTAEIVSKLLLLADDKTLKDPTILRQLLGK